MLQGSEAVLAVCDMTLVAVIVAEVGAGRGVSAGVKASVGGAPFGRVGSRSGAPLGTAELPSGQMQAEPTPGQMQVELPSSSPLELRTLACCSSVAAALGTGVGSSGDDA